MHCTIHDMQPPKYVYVDDVHSQQAQIKDAFPAVRLVLADIAHIFRR
jgi:hypothetical protein